MASISEKAGEELIARYVEGLRNNFDKSAKKLPDSVVANRRQHPRQEFDSTRMIAPWDGETPLRESDFQPTLCRDLSTNGVAFWTDQKPSEGYVVVKFDVNGEVVYLKARIAHAAPEFADGRPAFLAGCEFVGRLDIDLILQN